MEKTIITGKASQPDGLLNELLLSHELMHELTAIKWSLAMMLHGKFGKVNKEQEDILGKIITKNEALISLVDGLLGGHHGGHNSEADVQDCVQNMIEQLAQAVQKKEIEVTFKKSAGPLPKTSVEKGVAIMAIKNIFDNAIKYTPDHGKIHIEVGWDEKMQCVKVMIRDSGIGLSKEQQEKLFTQFFRSSDAAKANPSGSGMGLFITHQIMEAHQGDIRVESEGQGKGSTFYIDFPVNRKALS